MSRFKDHTFNLSNDQGNINSWDAAQLAALYDIRDELKRLNAVLNCPNFLEVPAILREIRKNTKKRKKARAVGKPKLRVVNR